MTNKNIFLSLLLLAAILIGCKNEKKTQETTKIEIQPIEHMPEIREAQGIIGEGTSMNLIEFVATEGDTLYIANPEQSVVGGLTVGESISVVYTAKGDSLTVNKAVNITALAHLWSQLDDYGNEQSLELTPEGEAYTVNMGKLNYDSWRIKDGALLLHSPAQMDNGVEECTDTFAITQLTDRLLILSSGNIDTAFER